MQEGESGALPTGDSSVSAGNWLTPSDMGVAESCAMSCADLRGMQLMSIQEAEFLVEFECTEPRGWPAFIERTLRKWSGQSKEPPPSAPPPSAPPPSAPPPSSPLPRVCALSAHPAKKQVSRSVQGEVERLRKRMRMPVMESLCSAHFEVQYDA